MTSNQDVIAAQAQLIAHMETENTNFKASIQFQEQGIQRLEYLLREYKEREQRLQKVIDEFRCGALKPVVLKLPSAAEFQPGIHALEDVQLPDDRETTLQVISGISAGSETILTSVSKLVLALKDAAKEPDDLMHLSSAVQLLKQKLACFMAATRTLAHKKTASDNSLARASLEYYRMNQEQTPTPGSQKLLFIFYGLPDALRRFCRENMCRAEPCEHIMKPDVVTARGITRISVAHPGEEYNPFRCSMLMALAKATKVDDGILTLFERSVPRVVLGNREEITEEVWLGIASKTSTLHVLCDGFKVDPLASPAFVASPSRVGSPSRRVGLASRLPVKSPADHKAASRFSASGS